MEHLITDDIPQGCFQKIVLSLKVIVYFFSVSLLNLLSGLMREVEPHICFEPDPSSKWSDERVQMERADSTLLKADQPVQFFSDLLSFRNSLQNCFLRFFCRWKEGGLHLAWGRPGSAMTIQLCNCNAIGQPLPRAACNTTKLQNTLKYNEQRPHCNTICSTEVQWSCSVHIAKQRVVPTLQYNEQCQHCKSSSAIQCNVQCSNTIKLQYPHCKTTSSAHIAMTIRSPAIGQWASGRAGQSAAGGKNLLLLKYLPAWVFGQYLPAYSFVVIFVIFFGNI